MPAKGKNLPVCYKCGQAIRGEYITHLGNQHVGDYYQHVNACPMPRTSKRPRITEDEITERLDNALNAAYRELFGVLPHMDSYELASRLRQAVETHAGVELEFIKRGTHDGFVDKESSIREVRDEYRDFRKVVTDTLKLLK